ncbi:MAG: hypothetical protein ACRDH2_13700, partial [Anaerolineales bacterium]
MARLARFVWLMVLSLLLAACGSALAAEQPAALPTVAASPTLASEPTAKVAATVVPTPLSGKTAPPAPTETPMPTAQPKEEPTLGYYNITPLANATLVTPFPTPVSALTLDEHLVNILLIGTDWRAAENGFRTDTLIVVSID